MTDYIPNLMGRRIVMISDYVSKDYDAEDQKEEKLYIAKIKKGLKKFGIPFNFHEVKNLTELKEKLSNYDKNNMVVFNWCEEIEETAHTEFLVTRFLEKNDYVFSGAGTTCILKTTDRNRVHSICIKKKISVPSSYSFKSPASSVYYPVIVKALYEHGSFALSDKSILQGPKDLKRIRKLINEDNFYMEDFIGGREFNVAVLGNNKPEVLPIMEVVFDSETDKKFKIQSFDSKWNKNSPSYNGIYLTKARNIAKKLRSKITKLALKTHKVFCCSGVSRIEIRVKDGIPYVIDVNSNPNLRLHVSIFKAAKQAGYNEGLLVAKLCELAMERHLPK